MIGLYNCSALADHQRVVCNNWSFGGILAGGVLDPNHTISDFKSLTELNDAITSGDLKIFKGVKGNFPAASPVEGENPLGCGDDNILDGFNNIFEYKDFNVLAENDTYYQTLNGRQTHLIWYECSQGNIRVVDQIVNWVALPAQVPENSKEKQHYLVQAKWSSQPDEFPDLHDGSALLSVFT